VNKLAGHYNPFGEYPAPVIPVFTDRQGVVSAGYSSRDNMSFLTIPESVGYVIHTESLRENLADFDYQTADLFAFSKTDVVAVDLAEEGGFLKRVFAEGRFDEISPFVAASLVAKSRDDNSIRRIFRNCLLELGTKPDEFVLSWYDSQRTRSILLADCLPANPTDLLRNCGILRVGCAPDKSLVLLKVARIFNNRHFSDANRPVCVSPLVVDSIDLFDPHAPVDCDIYLSDPALSPLFNFEEQSRRVFQFGFGEIVIALNPAFAQRIGEESGWSRILSAAAEDDNFTWMRPRSGTPLGSLFDLGILDTLGEDFGYSRSHARWIVESIEDKVRFYPANDTEALTKAFDGHRWHVDAVVAQRHSVASLFAKVDDSLQPMMVRSEGTKLMLPHDAFLLRGSIEDLGTYQALRSFERFVLSEDTDIAFRKCGMERTSAYRGDMGRLREMAMQASYKMSSLQRPISVCIALDVSGSMSGPKIGAAKVGASAFLGRLHSGRGDHAGLVTFSGQAQIAVHPGPFVTTGDAIGLAIGSLECGGNTALLDAILDAILATAHSEKRSLRAVVVLTDGCDNASTVPLEKVIAAATTYHSRVFCLAYGEDADYVLLKQIAEATGGEAYRGGINSIEALFSRIAFGL
jgi:Mg-chelatase subunit ChlD